MSSPQSSLRDVLTPALRRARVSVFVSFFVVGFILAAWLVNIPAIRDRTGVSHATLGLLLVSLGVGTIASMQACAVLNARWGSRRVMAVAVVAAAVTINLPVWSTSATTLAIALFVFGVANGAADIAMNDQAVIVEREYRRPIMSAFHAMWSVGGAAGAGYGALTQWVGIDVRIAVLAAGAVGGVLGTIAVAGLLPPGTAHQAAAGRQTAAAPQAGPGDELPLALEDIAAPTRRAVRSKVLVFGVLAFLLMLTEGVANDWAPLHAVEQLGQSESAASLSYGTFAVAMTAGRFAVDRVAERYGPVFVVRWGSALAALGMVVVVLSTTYPLTIGGWAVYGLGLAGVIPQLFSAAGNISPAHQSVLLSRVVGAGYIGQLAGPALIGVISHQVGLTVAFLVPLALCLLAAGAAFVVDPRRARVHETAASTVR